MDDSLMLSTTERVPGHDVKRLFGLVDGASVVSPGLGGVLSGGIAALSPGKVDEFNQLYTRTRALARKEMIRKARAKGANAILGIRYATSQIANGVCEILVYGTAAEIGQPAR